jgi:hypothetical protein
MKKGKFGFFNSKGIDVIPFEFNDTKGFSEDRAAIEKDSYWGFIDNGGKLVIPNLYTEVSNFEDGVAIVKRSDFFCISDKDHNYLLPCALDKVERLSDHKTLRIFKENKMAYFSLETRKYIWEEDGF